MEELTLRNRLFAYGFYSLAIVAFIGSAISLNPALIAFVGVAMLLSAAYLNSGHVINNFLIKRSKLIEVYNGYRLGTDLLSAVKRIGKRYKGVCIAVFEVYNPVDKPTADIGTALDSISQPFEFVISAREVSKKRMLDSLETKRKMKEIAITKINSKSYDKINELNRELSVIDNEIKTIAGNGKPLEVTLSIRATAESDTEIEAARESERNLEQLASVFSTTLNLGYTVLRGEELLEAIEVS